MNKLRKLDPAKFEYGKLPPQAIDVEEAILGCLIQFGAVDYYHLAKPEYFYKETHQIICTAIQELIKEKTPVDLILVTNKLKSMEKLDMVGGAYYVTILTQKIYSDINFYHHCLILREKFIHREIIRLCSHAMNQAFDESNDWKLILDTTIKELQSLYPDIKTSSHKSMKDITVKTIEDIFLYDSGEVKTFYKSNNPNLDNLVMFDSGITIIAGAGGIGKTTFVTHWMKSLLRNNDDISVLWVTIDHESGKSINRKMLGSYVRLTDRQIQSKNYKLSHEDLEKITATQDLIKHFDIEFYESPCSITDIEFKFRFFCNARPKDKMKVLLIDNIMRLTDNLNKSNQTNIDDYVANTLANIYNENKQDHKVHVMFLHHLTKDAIGKDNHADAYRPTYDMLKGSGRFGDIVETVILVNRPGHYPKLLAEYAGKEEYLKKLFIIDVPKNTYGETGSVYFMCNMNYGIFKEF